MITYYGLQNIESPDIRRKPDTGESSGKMSEISSVRSGTSISDNKTYREKIKERVQAAKVIKRTKYLN